MGSLSSVIGPIHNWSHDLVHAAICKLLLVFVQDGLHPSMRLSFGWITHVFGSYASLIHGFQFQGCGLSCIFRFLLRG